MYERYNYYHQHDDQPAKSDKPTNRSFSPLRKATSNQKEALCIRKEQFPCQNVPSKWLNETNHTVNTTNYTSNATNNTPNTTNHPPKATNHQLNLLNPTKKPSAQAKSPTKPLKTMRHCPNRHGILIAYIHKPMWQRAIKVNTIPFINHMNFALDFHAQTPN